MRHFCSDRKTIEFSGVHTKIQFTFNLTLSFKFPPRTSRWQMSQMVIWSRTGRADDRILTHISVLAMTNHYHKIHMLSTYTLDTIQFLRSDVLVSDPHLVLLPPPPLPVQLHHPPSPPPPRRCESSPSETKHTCPECTTAAQWRMETLKHVGVF